MNVISIIEHLLGLLTDDTPSSSAEMELKVLYFASAREEIGLREEMVRVAGGEAGGAAPTLADLRRVLCDKYPHAADTIAGITLARNLEYASDDVALQPGDEVALIPPISGG